MSFTFRGIEALAEKAEQQHLEVPYEQREALARDVLAEIGVTVRSESERGALRFSCNLPLGLHRKGDRSASAAIMWKTMRFNCFVCGGGSFLWYLASVLGVSGTEAKSWLRTRTTLDSEGIDGLLAVLKEIEESDRWEQDHLASYNPAILDQWKVIHPYMTEPPPVGRGVPEANVVDCLVGYDEEQHRIVIPHFWRGKLVGWVTRRLADWGPKYLNSPTFPKDRTLYRQNTEATTVLITESVMSVIKHYPLVEPEINMVATFGAECPESQLQMLRQYGRVILWMDPDVAGEKATVRICDYMADYADIEVVNNPYDVDPADLTHDDFLRVLSDRDHFIFWDEAGMDQYRDPRTRNKMSELQVVKTYRPYREE